MYMNGYWWLEVLIGANYFSIIKSNVPEHSKGYYPELILLLLYGSRDSAQERNSMNRGEPLEDEQVKKAK